MNDWQTWSAIAVVLLAVLFLASKMKGNKKPGSSCGHGCGCSKKEQGS